MALDFRNHPPRRLFLEGERASFEAALATVRQEFGRDYPIELAGRTVRSANVLAVPNPSHRDAGPIGHVHLAGEDEVAAALALAGEAQPRWMERGIAERAGILRRAAALMAERQEMIAAWEVHEAAKAWGEALADVDEAIDYLAFYAAAAEALEVSWRAYKPRGVVAVIPPWNFPAAIPCGMAAAALVAGNAVILKPAEQTPLVAYQVARVLHEAGVPMEVLFWLPGRGEVAGAALVGSPLVNMVAFTGSAAVGTAIYRQGGHIQPARGGLRMTVAEMGGKNPILVFPDADLDEAVVAILRSAFGHSNQKCSAASRILIHRDVYRRLRDRLVEGAASLPAGPADDPGTVVTPLIDEEARDRVLAAAKRAAAEGRILLEAPTPPAGSTNVGPTLVEIPAQSAATAATTTQEIFGPVLALVPFRDEQEALALANGTSYALTAGVFSRSPATIAEVVAGLDAGNVYVNRPTTGARVGLEPFGGHKLSGTGPKAGGIDYLWAFVTSKRGFRPEAATTDGTATIPAGALSTWSAGPRARARALSAAVKRLRGAQRSEWELALTHATGTDAGAHLDTLERLLARADEIARPEPTIELPGQQTHVRWDVPRGCGIILTGNGSPPQSQPCLLFAALLAGNGVVVAADGNQRPMAEVCIRALHEAGVPAASARLAPVNVDLAELAQLPAITFAACDAGLERTRRLYAILGDTGGTSESPHLKALITLADGPDIDEPGFLRRFALPKTVAIRTLHLGAQPRACRAPQRGLRRSAHRRRGRDRSGHEDCPSRSSFRAEETERQAGKRVASCGDAGNRVPPGLRRRLPAESGVPVPGHRTGRWRDNRCRQAGRPARRADLPPLQSGRRSGVETAQLPEGSELRVLSSRRGTPATRLCSKSARSMRSSARPVKSST